VLPFGDEALEICLGFTDRVRPRHADDIETLRACLLAERRLDGVWF
jgi:hypothetical protein